MKRCKARQFGAMLLALTVALLLPACARQQDDEMDRYVAQAPSAELAVAQASEDGRYTVVIGEENLMKDEQYAADRDELVTAEEAAVFVADADANEDAEAKTNADDKADAAQEPQTVELDADANAKSDAAQETKAVELDSDADAKTGATQEAQAVEVVAEPTTTEESGGAEAQAPQAGEWSLASVKQEDVTVCYTVYAPGDQDATAETLEADVVGFANNTDSIELSFADPSDDSAPDMYTVRFAGSDCYAVVIAVQDTSGFEVTGVDYEAAIKEELANTDIGFTADDVALPEGTYIEEGQLIATDDAPEVVQEVLVESGIAEEEMSRADPAESSSSDGNDGSGGSGDAALDYMKAYNECQKRFKNYDAGVDYTVETLNYVDPTVGKVSQFGSDAYYIFKGYYTGDVGSVLKGGMGVLKLFGLFKKKGPAAVPGVSNEQVLSEVQKVGLEVANVHCLVAAMNDTVNITKQELYSQGVEAYDNALLALEGDAEILQNMLTQGAVAAAQAGIEPPDEDCTADDEFEYNFQLIQFIKEQEQKKDRKSQKFASFTRYAEDLSSNFTLVAGATAKPPNTNPIVKYDKYWNTYFNYETQGYYLRQAYRSNIEYQLKRAFGILEIYHNIFDPEAGGVKLSYNNQFCSALESLEQMPAGTSPEEIDVRKSFRVYCPTFDCDVTRINIERFAKGNNVVFETLLEYANRLHGRTIEEDFKLAGLWGDGRDPTNAKVRLQWYDPPWEELGSNDNARRYNREQNYWYGGHGIGFNCKDKDSGHYVADIVSYDGVVYKEQPTFNCHTWETFKPYDLPKEGGPDDVDEMRYIFLGLAPHSAN